MKRLILSLCVTFFMILQSTAFVCAEGEQIDADLVILDPYACLVNGDNSMGKVVSNGGYNLKNLEYSKSGFAYGGRTQEYFSNTAAFQKSMMEFYPKLSQGEYMVYMCVNGFDNEIWARSGFQVNDNTATEQNWGYFAANDPVLLAKIVAGDDGYNWYPIGQYEFSGVYETDVVKVYTTNAGHGRSHVDALKFVKVAEPVYEGISFHGVDGSAGIDEAADVVALNFSAYVSKAGTTTVTVKDTTDNKDIALTFETKGKSLVLNLQTALKKDHSYQINVTGLNDLLGKYTVDKEVTFTAVANNELKTTTLTGSMSNTATGYAATGIVFGSHKKPIANRTVTVLAAQKDSNEKISVTTGISDSYGVYTVEFSIPENFATGDYDLYVATDFAEIDVKLGTVYVLNKEEAKTYLEYFKEERTADELKTYFETVEDDLMIDFTDDISKISSEESLNAFLLCFSKREFSDYTSFVNYYNGSLLLTKLNVVKTLWDLADMFTEENCKTLGVDYNLFVQLGSKQQTFLETMLAHEDFVDLEEFQQEYTKLATVLVLEEAGVSVSDFAIENISINEGKSYTIDLEAKDVLKLKRLTFDLVFDCDLSDFEIMELIGGTKTTNGKQLTAEFIYGDETLEECGLKLILGSDTPDTVNVTYNVTFVYDVSGEKISYTQEEKTFTVTKTSGGGSKDDGPEVVTPSFGGGGGGGGSSSGRPSGGSGSASKPTPKPEQTEPGKEDEGKDNTPVKPDNSKPQVNPFTDLEKTLWAKESIITLYNEGVVKGVTETEFAPNDFVTREAFCVLLYRAFGFENAKSTCDFTDITDNAWFYKEVSACVEKGIIKGYDDGSFGVGKSLTREDMAVMIDRCLQLKAEKDTVLYSDDSEISAYAKEAAYDLTSAGIMAGVGENRFAPKDTVTRAMTAKTICGAMERAE